MTASENSFIILIFLCPRQHTPRHTYRPTQYGYLTSDFSKKNGAGKSPYHKHVFANSGNLILFCASSWRSALAAKTLQDMGMTNIFDMEGGFNGWKSAGLPIETTKLQELNT
jgi:hypothetical protein